MFIAFGVYDTVACAHHNVIDHVDSLQFQSIIVISPDRLNYNAHKLNDIFSLISSFSHYFLLFFSFFAVHPNANVYEGKLLTYEFYEMT